MPGTYRDAFGNTEAPTAFDVSNAALGGLPLPGGLPSSRTGLFETFPRIDAAATYTPASGTWFATPIWIPIGRVITGITMFSGATALGTGTHQWFCLWDKDLALVANAADDTSTAWAANAAKRLALTSPKTTTYGGLYYVGGEISVSAGNVPNLVSMGAAAVSGALRALTPANGVLDSSTAVTAAANPLVQAAAAGGSHPPIYIVLD